MDSGVSRIYTQALWLLAFSNSLARIGRLADRGLHRLEQTSRAFSHWECLTAFGLPWIFQVVGRVNWRHGLCMVLLPFQNHRRKSLKSSSILLIQLLDRLNVATLKDSKIWSGKPFFVSSSISCRHFLHPHKTESRPEIHWLHQEWISYYFPMKSSTQESACNSSRLRKSKNTSSKWMRTNDIEALKRWKGTCSSRTRQTPVAPTHSMKLLPIPPLALWSGSQDMLLNGRSKWIYNHSESSIVP